MECLGDMSQITQVLEVVSNASVICLNPSFFSISYEVVKECPKCQGMSQVSRNVPSVKECPKYVAYGLREGGIVFNLRSGASGEDV